MSVIQSRRNRQTGTIVEVIDNRDGRFEADSEYRWATVCVDHGNYVLHSTKLLALEFAPAPLDWCAACQLDACADEIERKETAIEQVDPHTDADRVDESFVEEVAVAMKDRLDAKADARRDRSRRKFAKLMAMTIPEVEAELDRRNAARARNLELSIIGPPRSRFAYASAITRGDRAIVELEDRLRDLRRRESWR